MRKFLLRTFCFLMLLTACCNKIQARDFFDNGEGDPQFKKITLLKALREIKSRYSVNLVYQKKFVSGKTIEANFSYTQPIEQLLAIILNPFQLKFEKTALNTFVIFPAAQKNIQVSSSQGNTASRTTENTDIGKAGSSENLEITGIVTDENGKPLPDVSIVEMESSNGTYSNKKGEFLINVKSASGNLVVSYIGYKNLVLPLENGRHLSVKMVPDVKQNEEVIVIAYGTKDKKDLVGAVSAINDKEISKSMALSPQMAMQGRMPGVFVSSPGGDPNATPVVRIRGVSTFSGKNSGPLYVVDGVVIDEYGSRSTFSLNAQKADDVKGSQNIFNLINPADISSISVLKDASSAAAYGARAANGVVLITTKKGIEGRPQVSFSTHFGSSNILKTLSVLNTEQYVAVINEANAGNPDFDDPKYNIYKKGTSTYMGDKGTYDWQSAIVNKNASYRNYDISVSGGSKNSSYYLGAGYAFQESSLKFNNQKRYSLSSRTEFKINKILELGQTLRLAYTDLLDNRDNTGVPIALRYVFSTPPWQPIYGNGPNGFAKVGVSEYGPETKQNFLGAASVTNKRNGTYKMLGNVFIKLSPLENLHVIANLGGDYFTQKELQWSLRTLNDFEKSLDNGNSIGETTTENFLLQKRLSVNYTTSIANKHFIDLYVHAEHQRSTFNSLIAGRSRINDVDDPNLFSVNGQGASADSYKDINAFTNYLARISYKYTDKYYVDVNFLRQGSSVFNPDGYQWGNFPSLAAAWRISKEHFMNLLADADIKLKFGVGELGNSDTKGWQYLTLINNTNAAYVIGGTAVLGAFFTNYPNLNLTWERLRTYTGGVEATIMNEKLNFSFEYYKRITSKILQPYRLPASVGVIDLPFKNIGAAVNSGIEFLVSYANQIGRVNYSVGGNITTTKNRVTKLNENVPVSTPVGLVVLGDPINSLYGFKSDGVIKTEKELTEYKAKFAGSSFIQQLQLGDLRYQDVGGAPTAADMQMGRRYHNVPDGKIDDYDGLAYLGKTIPGFFYGINLGVAYKSFDLSVLLQGVGDVKKQNDVLLNGMIYRFSNKLSEVLNRWTPANPGSDIPRAINYGAGAANNSRFSDRFIESASFLRFANLQVGYNLPEKLCKRAKYLERCRVYLSASNILIVTAYSGYDPENDLVPQPRTIVAGLNIGF